MDTTDAEAKRTALLAALVAAGASPTFASWVEAGLRVGAGGAGASSESVTVQRSAQAKLRLRARAKVQQSPGIDAPDSCAAECDALVAEQALLEVLDDEAARQQAEEQKRQAKARKRKEKKGKQKRRIQLAAEASICMENVAKQSEEDMEGYVEDGKDFLCAGDTSCAVETIFEQGRGHPVQEAMADSEKDDAEEVAEQEEEVGEEGAEQQQQQQHQQRGPLLCASWPSLRTRRSSSMPPSPMELPVFAMMTQDAPTQAVPAALVSTSSAEKVPFRRQSSKCALGCNSRCSSRSSGCSSESLPPVQQPPNIKRILEAVRLSEEVHRPRCTSADGRLQDDSAQPVHTVPIDFIRSQKQKGEERTGGDDDAESTRVPSAPSTELDSGLASASVWEERWDMVSMHECQAQELAHCHQQSQLHFMPMPQQVFAIPVLVQLSAGPVPLPEPDVPVLSSGAQCQQAAVPPAPDLPAPMLPPSESPPVPDAPCWQAVVTELAAKQAEAARKAVDASLGPEAAAAAGAAASKAVAGGATPAMAAEQADAAANAARRAIDAGLGPVAACAAGAAASAAVANGVTLEQAVARAADAALATTGTAEKLLGSVAETSVGTGADAPTSLETAAGAAKNFPARTKGSVLTLSDLLLDLQSPMDEQVPSMPAMLAAQVAATVEANGFVPGNLWPVEQVPWQISTDPTYGVQQPCWEYAETLGGRCGWEAVVESESTSVGQRHCCWEAVSVVGDATMPVPYWGLSADNCMVCPCPAVVDGAGGAAAHPLLPDHWLSYDVADPSRGADLAVILAALAPDAYED